MIGVAIALIAVGIVFLFLVPWVCTACEAVRLRDGQRIRRLCDSAVTM
jgi:hypothetical protein